MEEREDSVGVAVGAAAGLLLGTALAMPAIPADGVTLRLGSVALDTVGTVLLVSALSVLLLPLGLFSLYRIFSLADR